MFICICKAVKKSELDELVKDGCNLEEVKKACGAGTDCGSCGVKLQKALEDLQKTSHKQEQE